MNRLEFHDRVRVNAKQSDFYIDPNRQCQTAAGRPKRQFRTVAEAERAAKQRGAKYSVYLCTFGHLHIGRRYKT